MEITALQFMIICPLVFLAGFVDAVAGGGGLISLAKVINLTTNLTALAVYLLNGKVILILGLTAGCFSIAGNYAGTWFFARWGAKSVKPLMLIVLVIFFIKICSDMIV